MKFDAEGNPLSSKEGFSIGPSGGGTASAGGEAKDTYREMSKKLEAKRMAAAAAEEAKRLLGFKQQISQRVASGTASPGDWDALEEMNTKIFNLPKDHIIS